MQAAFHFYFYFTVGYILGHLDLFSLTKWQWFYWKYLKCKFKVSNNINRSQVRMPDVCGLDCNSVRNDSQISE